MVNYKVNPFFKLHEEFLQHTLDHVDKPARKATLHVFTPILPFGNKKPMRWSNLFDWQGS